jgi:multidrug efflux pump subunit AcrA (membrane-fusion protein)
MNLIQLLKKKRVDARAEYRTIVARSVSPRNGDAERLLELASVLAFSEGEVQGDLDAVGAGLLSRAAELEKVLIDRPNRVAFLERAEAGLQAARDAETQRRREADERVAELDAARSLAERRLAEIDAATDELKRLKNQHTRLFAESEVL